jgi:hypothetical protein
MQMCSFPEVYKIVDKMFIVILDSPDVIDNEKILVSQDYKWLKKFAKSGSLFTFFINRVNKDLPFAGF